MLLKIVTPNSLFIELKIKSLNISHTPTGAITILPLHKAYISYLNKGEIRIKDYSDKEHIYKIGQGFLHVENYRCSMNVSDIRE